MAQPPLPPSYTASQSLPGVTQPVNWMPRPTEIIPGCPPGLEYLTQLDQILVHQQVELFEVMTGTKKTATTLLVRDSKGLLKLIY